MLLRFVGFVVYVCVLLSVACVVLCVVVFVFLLCRVLCVVVSVVCCDSCWSCLVLVGCLFFFSNVFVFVCLVFVKGGDGLCCFLCASVVGVCVLVDLLLHLNLRIRWLWMNTKHVLLGCVSRCSVVVVLIVFVFL